MSRVYDRFIYKHHGQGPGLFIPASTVLLSDLTSESGDRTTVVAEGECV